MAKLEISTESNGDVIVVYIHTARLDESHAGELAYQLGQYADKKYKPLILVNMKEVTYISSAIIGKIAAFQKRMNKDKGKLKLCSVAPAVLKVFKITKMNKILAIYGDATGAMNAFKSGK